jgi:hypothetical protein
MTTHVQDVTTGVGLLIDGDVVAGGEGMQAFACQRVRVRRPGPAAQAQS